VRFCFHKYNTGGIFDGSNTFATLAINLGMLPSFMTGWAVFPVNPPSWSIFFEVWVNVLFFVVWRRLGTRFLWTLITIGAVGLIASAVIYSKLDVGAGIDDFVPGFARVVFSFFLGVAIFRSKIAERWQLGARTATAVIILLMLILNARAWLPAGWCAAGDLVTVFLFFPMAVIVLAAARLPPFGCRIAAVLGGSSYAVYLLQLPIMGLVTGFTSVLLGKQITDYVPIVGIVFMPCFLGLSYLTYRFFELPAKNWMRGLLRREGTDKTVRLKLQYDEKGVTKVTQEQGPVAGA
jgi:peptidoglycan/LPS O-acetylase OafA/YrhL